MKLDLNNKIDAVIDGTQEIAENAQEATSEFHEKYVSKVIPDLGKYGDAVTFVAEMVPGVSEYNAIREGDWQAFAISAGLDVAALAIGAATAGAGYAALKGGTTVAKDGVKVAAKEVAEAGVEKAAKEIAENGAEKTAKEIVEAGAEKAAKEIAEEGAEKAIKETVGESVETAVKEVDEVAQIVKNRIDGEAREIKEFKNLVDQYGAHNVISQAFIRDSSGIPIKDILTNETRRIDFIVIDGEKVIRSIEVTSETADKALQTAKELRILEQAKNLGGAFVKNPATGKLIKFGEDIVTEIVRLK